MEIPYTTEARPDTGLYNGKFGIWLFLASEVMLFGGLFSAYVFLRNGASDWHAWHEAAELNISLATFNTAVLIASSVTMVMSWASLKMNQFGRYRMYLALTVLCGLIFLVVKYFEYSAKFHHQHYPSTNTFLAIYFTMTGLHGIHVLAGMVVNTYFLGPGAKMWRTEPLRLTNRLEISGLYWHFVDLVWIFLFPVLYLL
ncbi:MAG: cytochrome c oxidase subunit 3 [Candidatus Hydrogenedentes bacterium]|nr:cytochrome c oxidase subunit 3 [Candidatus Hydrogenedentota bacterium]